MTYRPPGWKTLKAKNHPLHCLHPDDCVGQSYEVGADAMLEALRKQGVHDTFYVKDGEIVHDNGKDPFIPAPVTGTLVFIPDSCA